MKPRTYFDSVLSEIEARANRAELIRKADDRCQGKTKFGQPCNWLAFTNTRQAQLSLRPKRSFPDGQETEGFWVLCPTCATTYDRKHPAKQQRKAS